MASHDTRVQGCLNGQTLQAVAWRTTDHLFDVKAHVAVADVEFPNQEIVHKIESTNQSLRNGARDKDATYAIELVKDSLKDQPTQAVFQLRLVRTKHTQSDLTDRHPIMEGSMELLCRYTLYLNKDEVAHEHQFDHILSKSAIHSFATAEARAGSDKDVAKEFVNLLIHLMLFCVASARKRVSIKAEPDTASVFRPYDEFSKFDYHTWQDLNREVDIEAVNSERLEDESRCIDASRSFVSAKHFRKLSEDDIESLKMTASLNIIKCTRNMTEGVSPPSVFENFFI